MSLPRFDLENAVAELRAAKAANVAKASLNRTDAPPAQQSTLAALATLAGVDADTKFSVAERAAIMAVDGGLPEGWADALAAILCGPRPAYLTRPRWAELHDPVLRFADAHAAKLAELGWTFEELFCAPENWNRLDQRGIGWSICVGELVRATSQTITFIRDGAQYTHKKPPRANHDSVKQS